MDRQHVLNTLREHASELQAAGVLSLSVFGSTARGEAEAGDVDIAVRLAGTFSSGGLDYYHRLEQLEKRLSTILSCKVDVVPEPVRKERFQREIDRDRALAF
jgi:predicted nucleotidyltransferase